MEDWTNKVKFKHTTCRNKNGERYSLENNQISLYVVLTRKCNTQCKFCEFREGKSNINTELFNRRLEELREVSDIGTIHFTGGEPTLEIEKLKTLCKIIKKQDSSIITSVNTNGTKLKELENIEELDNIALSRHSISDEENKEVFGSSLVPSADYIKNFKDKEKIHLSCNLIRGYIDSSEKIIQYLEFAASLGINDIGLVSLMKVNKYCSDKFIDFSNIELPNKDKLIKTRCYSNISETTKKECCRCENYLYRASNLKLVSMYHRYAIKNTEIADYLVYEDNHIKQGFSGEIII